MYAPHKALLLGLPLAFLLSAADPPPDVDAALRSRVQDFYQLQVDRKFRQAEQLVAADTKDFYYESRKLDIRAFKIVKIEYAPDFQSATVTISSKREILIPGAAPKVLDFPSASYWKIEDGKWCWYVDQSKLLDTPFGRLHPQTAPKAGGASDVPKVPQPMSVAALVNGVHADTTRVQLDPEHPEPRTVILKNTLPGPVTIQLSTGSPALKVEIAKPNLGAEESTQITITPVAGSSDRPAQLLIKVGPTGQTIRIDLDYGPGK